ncbi:5-formyltetrahydrofolate cyclo-ligase [Mycena indigotica]|uniref:5-formyltetrahydrofolate cyclo-ligase n=1 Tax=Mycena indigotica TaxID=2126181 RepID=A0A8H6WKU9_9AGAR|nr:5-formyltetrahydrofolate cyclo-ligase [Mycena indigotica]KAF7316119.1 5-formyltetrahydrofolate cyclo-ligase [Mycena indigotica]
MALALKAEKKLLRKAMASKLKNLVSVSEQSKAVTERILRHPYFARCASIGCYLSMPSGEIDTDLLVRSILRSGSSVLLRVMFILTLLANSGKTLYVPNIDKTIEGRMELLRVYDEADLDSLPSGVWGIREPGQLRNGQPRASAEDTGLDLILVPGLAFDRSFSRLGHGKGYYDRFITTYSTNRPTPLLMGLALQEQLLDAGTIPTASHDWKMDSIVVDGEEIEQGSD